MNETMLKDDRTGGLDSNYLRKSQPVQDQKIMLFIEICLIGCTKLQA